MNFVNSINIDTINKILSGNISINTTPFNENI